MESQLTILQPDKPWTAKGLGEYLDVSEKTVRNWVSRRQVPHVKLMSGAVRFLKKDIDAWLASQKVKVERPIRTKLSIQAPENVEAE